MISDGPLLLAANPNKKYTEDYEENDNDNGKNVEEKRKNLPPQRHWEKALKDQNYHTNIFAANTLPVQPVIHDIQTASRNSSNQTASNKPNQTKPNTIREVSFEFSSTGIDGEEVLKEKSVYHDDFQVYRSSAYQKKVKRLEKLKENAKNKGLKSAKGKVKNRFIVTKAHPETTEEDVEIELMDEFIDVIEEIYVRKNPMVKHKYYSTFVVFITTNDPIDVRMIEDYTWPGDVCCFFVPNKGRVGN